MSMHTTSVQPSAWVFLNDSFGSEARALDIIQKLEALYIARTIEKQVALAGAERADRILDLLMALSRE